MDQEYFDALLAQAYEKLQEPTLAEQKQATVEKKYQEKVSTLGYSPKFTHSGIPRIRDDFYDLGNSYTMMGDTAISNSNKIYNNLSGKQMQQLLSDTYNQRLITEPETGRTFQYGDWNKSKGQWDKKYIDEPIEEGYLYGGNSKLDPNIDKFGYAKYGVEPRYTPGLKQGYGWSPGPGGIDPTKAYMNWRLPDNVAKRMEGLIHGNKYDLEARAMFDDQTDYARKMRQILGSGASEYYDDSKMALLNQEVGSEPGNIYGGTPLDQALANRSLNMDKEYNDDTYAETLLKTPIAGAAHILSNAMDYGAEKVADAAIALGIDDEKGMQATKDFWNQDGDIMKWVDNAIGLNETYSEEATKEFMDAIKNGKYGDAAKSAFSNIGIHISNSLPEMAALYLGAPATALAIAARVQDQKNDFKKINKTEPSATEELSMFATNAAVLMAEKLLVFGPMKKIFGKLVGKADPAAREQIFSTLAKGIGTSAAGEFFQEMADQAQENFWRKGGSGDVTGVDAITEAYNRFKTGKVMSKEEALGAGALGAILGGVIRGGGETLVTPKRIARNRSLDRQKEAGKFLVGQEGKLADALNEMSVKETKDYRDRIDTAIDIVEKAPDVDTIMRSENNEVRETIRSIIQKKLRNMTGREGKVSQSKYIDTVKKSIKRVKNSSDFTNDQKLNLFNTLTKNTEYTPEEILSMDDETLNQAMDKMSIENIDNFNEILNPEKAHITRLALMGEEDMNGIKDKVVEVFSKRKDDADRQIKEYEQLSSEFNKGREESPTEKTSYSVPKSEIKSKIKSIKDTLKKSINNELSSTKFDESEEISTQNKKVSDLEQKVKDNPSDTETKKELAKEKKALDSMTKDFYKNKYIDSVNKEVTAYKKSIENGKEKGVKKEPVDVNKVRELSKRNKMQIAKDILTFSNKGKEKAIDELNKYSNKSLDSLISDPAVPDDIKSYARDVKYKRSDAAKLAGINQSILDDITTLSTEKGNRRKTVKVISDIVKSKRIDDKKIVDEAKKLFQSAYDQKFITKSHLDIYNKRLKKISKDAKYLTKEEEDQRRKTYEDVSGKSGTKSEYENATTKIELDEKDILNEVDELGDKYNAVNDKLNKLKQKTMNREPTAEEQAEIDSLNKESQTIGSKLAIAVNKKFIFTGNELAYNSQVDLITRAGFDMIAEVSVDQALTQEELDILGNICK